MGITVNGPSGIDTNSIITQLTELEMQKVYKIEDQKKTVNKRIDAYSQFETFISDISKSAANLNDREDFNMYTTTSSSTDTASVSTSFGAQPGSYGLKVFQLAEREKLISSDGLVTNNQTDLSALGVAPGKFKINGVEIELASSDSLEDLRLKINSAKKADGTKLGVSATVLKMADNNYRFVLTSDETGSAGASYEDSAGTVLQSLGFINGAAAPKTTQTFESAGNMKSAFAALNAGEEITVKGTDPAGKSVSSTYVKGAADTEDDFLSFVETAFGSKVTASIDAVSGKMKIEDTTAGVSTLAVGTFMVNGTAQDFNKTVTGSVDTTVNKGITKETYTSNANMNTAFSSLAVGGKITVKGTDSNGKAVEQTYVRGGSDTSLTFTKFVESAFNGAVSASIDSTSGKLKVEDKNGGNSLFSISEFSIEGAASAFTRTVTGFKSPSVLSVGRDAYFSVDNIPVSSSTNKPSGIAKGVNFDLKAVGYDKTTTVSITRDVSGLAKKVGDLINAYNAVSRYVDTSTKYVPNDDESGAQSGVLVGDMTAKTINAKVRGVFMESFNITGNTTFTSLSQLGIKTNTTSGQYELDNKKFETALNTNFEEVVSLFVNEGYTDNSNVMFGTKTKDTVEGAYDLVEDAGQYKIKLKDVVDNNGNVTKSYPFYNGVRNGDVISFEDGPAKGLFLTAPAGSGDAQVTYSKGLAGRLTDLVTSITGADSGTLAVRKKSMQSQIKSYTTMAEAMKKRVTAFTDRLTKQFSAMEQTMSTLKSQQSAMMSQLGMSYR